MIRRLQISYICLYRTKKKSVQSMFNLSLKAKKSIEQDMHISEAPSPEDDAAVESVIDAPHYSPSPPPQTPAPTSPSPDVEPQKAETPAVTALEGEDEDEDMQIASDEEKDDEGAQPG